MFKVLLGLGAVFALVSLAKAKGGASTVPRLPPRFTGSVTDPTVAALPPNSEPATNLGSPSVSTAQASSGRAYHVWMFPPAAAGVYTIARLAGSTQWLSFVYHSPSDKRIPGKTNVSDPSLLSQMRSDWLLAA